MNKPLLSICIPTYNRANLLVKAISSIVEQPIFSSGKIEVVVTDNCSTDETKKICEEFMSKYENIKPYYILNRNSEDKKRVKKYGKVISLMG